MSHHSPLVLKEPLNLFGRSSTFLTKPRIKLGSLEPKQLNVTAPLPDQSIFQAENKGKGSLINLSKVHKDTGWWNQNYILAGSKPKKLWLRSHPIWLGWISDLKKRRRQRQRRQRRRQRRWWWFCDETQNISTHLPNQFNSTSALWKMPVGNYTGYWPN